MTFAVLADIHANSFALLAVLADLQRFNITTVINLGDHLSGPIDPAGTADILMAQDFIAIRGNHDRWLLDKDPATMGATDRFSFDALRPHHLDWLKTLPPTALLPEGEPEDAFLCHGTPTSDDTYWLERVTPGGTVRPATRAEVEREAKDITASLILCGHTHVPRCVRLSDGRMVLNPGSVGCPAYDDDAPLYHRMQTGTPHAAYAIVEGVGRDRAITFRVVPYNAQEAADLAARNGREDWARSLATGWHDPD